MKQKIFTSLLGLGLLLLAFPASTQADSFSIHRNIQQVRNRLEQRETQIHERLCSRFANIPRPLSLPAWCAEVVPPPPPPPPPPGDNGDGEGMLLITEVYYDVDGTHGVETTNEWVEIYNGTDQAADLSGWMIGDSAGSDVLPEGTVLASNAFMVVSDDASTETFWSLPDGTVFVALDSAIGNGLANGGDAVYLKNVAAEIIDSMSYGTNTDAFDPSVPAVAPGHSIMRTDINSDTDTAADWSDAEFPGPGGAA